MHELLYKVWKSRQQRAVEDVFAFKPSRRIPKNRRKRSDQNFKRTVKNFIEAY